jgi:predicted transcriptional regulator
MEIVPALVQLGFAEYEARAYLALVQRSPLNGYELAKTSGIPRANIYAILDRLSARRAVVRLDEPGGTRYAPVPPGELLQRLGDEFRAVADETRQSLEQLGKLPQYDTVLNTRGYAALLDAARATLVGAQRSLVIALWPDEAAVLKNDLAAASARGITITTLCMVACARECGGCQGHLFRYRMASPGNAARWFLVVRDDEEMIAGEVTPGGDTLTVQTRQPLIVELASSYVRHSIALAAVVGDLGARVETLVSVATQRVLDSLCPPGGAGFFDRMREMLRAAS